MFTAAPIEGMRTSLSTYIHGPILKLYDTVIRRDMFYFLNANHPGNIWLPDVWWSHFSHFKSKFPMLAWFLFIFSLHSHSKKWFCLSMRSLSYNYLTTSLYFWKPPIEAWLYTVISSDHYLLPSEEMIQTYVFAFDYIFSFTWTPSWMLSMSLTYIMRIIFTRVTQWGIRGGIKYCWY